MIRPLAILLFLALATSAMAQPMACGPKDKVINGLAEKHGETGMIELGNSDGTAVWHLYANAKTGTWSLIGFPSPAVACFIGSGKSIEPMGSSIPGQPL